MRELKAGPFLSQAQLDAVDPTRHGRPRRLCPFCGAGKPLDDFHASLSVDLDRGLWHCHRCKAGGAFRETWSKGRGGRDLNLGSRSDKKRTSGMGVQKPSLPGPTSKSGRVDEPGRRRFRQLLRTVESLSGTPGEQYLLRERGIPSDVATKSCVRYSDNWCGRPSIVFPLRDFDGKLVAGHARSIHDRRMSTHGTKSLGVFVTSGALDPGTLSQFIIIVEAPIDALSLAAAGYPAVAFCGTSGPTWLQRLCGLRRVLIAFDNDGNGVGDIEAEKLAAQLVVFGAQVERLKPQGVKDWNDYLTRFGRDALSDALALAILAGPIGVRQ